MRIFSAINEIKQIVYGVLFAYATATIITLGIYITL